MVIVNNSIRVIDYVNETVYKRDTPESFNEYVTELIGHINNNTSVRAYKTLSNSTEIISCILGILCNQKDTEFVTQKNDIIAQRLIRTEKEVQKRISNMNKNVKFGSLIQALIFDENIEKYSYLLAKVEHSDFIDDYDFSFKTGFSKDKKTIWKSCLIDLYDMNSKVFDAKVYSDTKAKYWSGDFLELEEVINDEANTVNAFKAIDSFLKRNLRKESLQDYTVIRNAFISYMKSYEHIDYINMVDSIIGGYIPYKVNINKLSDLKVKLYELPTKRKFDYQFNSIAKAINARIGQVYKVNTGIEVKITDSIPNLRETIMAFQDTDGNRYLKIKTTDMDTYESFKVD